MLNQDFPNKEIKNCVLRGLVSRHDICQWNVQNIKMKILNLGSIQVFNKLRTVKPCLEYLIYSSIGVCIGGSLILTNIYLLVGVSLPLWLWPEELNLPAPLPLYAGWFIFLFLFL